MPTTRTYSPLPPMIPAEDIFCTNPCGPREPNPCPHTYGVRVCSCAAFATDTCRPTACTMPSPYPSTDHCSLLGYRYVSPNGDGLSVAYSVTHSHTDHSSLITAHSSYTFSAKEKDSETGFSYFGSRYYSSDLSIWLSVDPMSGKYPSLSPYVYCADNPVKLVDPNGEEWDIDGYKYYPGQNCPKDAQQSTRNKWNAMNNIYRTKEGKDVIDYMNKEGVWYCVSSEACPSGLAGGEYVPDGNKTGGTIYLNGANSDVGLLAHEMFHGYQDQKKQGDASQHNELQARLFSDDVTSQVRLITAVGMPQLHVTEKGIAADLFRYNVDKVLSGSYTDINMRQLEDLFSSFERFGGYRNLHEKIDGQTDLYGELKNK